MIELLYGSKVRIASDTLVVFTAITFCIPYTIYFGKQLDQILCDSFEIFSCGGKNYYRIAISILILPAVYKKQFRNVFYISLVASIATMIAIIMIIIYEVDKIATDGAKSDLKHLSFSEMCAFFGVTMSLFEGNQLILNLYSEVKEPRHFLGHIIWIFFAITFLGITVSILSYNTYGRRVDDIILYNLPDSTTGTTVKILYMMTIFGIYVIIILPVFQ